MSCRASRSGEASGEGVPNPTRFLPEFILSAAEGVRMTLVVFIWKRY